MQIDRLSRMKRGWLIGDFEPTVLHTKEVEVAVKSMSKGEYEARHYHKIATEITVVISGRARMNGQEIEQGDIVVLRPGECADFEALTDVVLTVVKHPGASNDKYMAV